MNLKKIFFCIVIFIFLGCFSTYSSLYAADEFSINTSTYHTYAPQGSKVSVMKFIVNMKKNGLIVDRVKVELQNSIGIERCYLYKDQGGDVGEYDEGQEALVGTVSFEGNSTPTFLNINGADIVSGNSITYFIVCDIETDADIQSTTNITLKQVWVDDGVNEISVPPNDVSVVDITGFQVYEGVDITGTEGASQVAIPGKEDVPVLLIRLQSAGEDAENIKIKVKNVADNFVTTANRSDGVVTAKLYRAVTRESEGGEFISRYDTTGYPNGYVKAADDVVADGFMSSSMVEFTLNENLSLTSEGDIQHFFVVYDIGSNFQVSGNTGVNAQLYSVEAEGDLSYSVSDVKMTKIENSPSTVPEVTIGGLIYDGLYSIVPADSNFGSGTIAPMMKCKLLAYQVGVTVDSITIENGYEDGISNGYIPFVTNSDDENGIKEVMVYWDDGDGKFEGYHDGSPDTLIGSLSMGSGFTHVQNGRYPGNAIDYAVITLDTKIKVEPTTIVSGTKYESPEYIYILYRFGSDIDESSGTGNVTARVRLRNMLGDTIIDDSHTATVNLSGTLPGASSPESEVELVQASLSLMHVSDISPDTVIEGQQKVPMLYLELLAETSISGAQFNIKDPKKKFLSNNSGISRVLLYRDVSFTEGNFSATFDISEDLPIAVVSSYNGLNSAILSDVYLQEGSKRYFVCYDIGQIAAGGTAQCQIEGISGDSLIFVGEMPAPRSSAQIIIGDKRIQVTKVEAPDYSIDMDLPESLEVRVRIKNISNESVYVTDVLPKFYKGHEGGDDISSQFNIELSNQSTGLPSTVNAGEFKNFIYNVSHVKPYYGGTVLGDAYVQYQVNDNVLVTERYWDGSDWQAAAGEATLQIYTEALNEQKDWNSAEYIESMYIYAPGSSAVEFKKDDSVRAGSALVIKHADSLLIDQSDINVLVNGVSIQYDQNKKAFSYNSNTKEIRIPDLGEESGQITLIISGVATDYISYIIEDTIRVRDLYFYPSPYYPSQSDLILGFNLTQQADVTVYLFNHLGMKVWENVYYSMPLGYRKIEINRNSDFISSGMYICKLKAIDNNGNENIAVTKLAVY